MAWLLPSRILVMRRTLRNTETSLFLKADGTETEFMELACCFQNYEEALSFTRKKQLKNVELVVRSASASDEFTLALPAAAALPHWE